MRKITLFAMLLVGILAGRAQSALVGTYDGNINPVHMNGAGEELTGKTVVISETDKGEINVTLPSFVLMTGMSTKEVTIENITVTNNEDGTCTLSSDSVAITPVNPMNPDMVMVPYKSTLTGVVGNGAIELAVAVSVQPDVIMTTATFNGAKRFELVSVEPSADAPVTTVNFIKLVFSKEVTVTIPEGGIEVVNNDTEDVIKLTSVMENEYLDKTDVYFLFEKKVVTDKDGKEEEQEQYISAAGAYSFTIPAGCIQSVDGDEFADSTFTFSVVGTFELTDWSPKETTELSKIELTFEEEIMDIKMSADLTLYRNWVEEVTNKVVDASVSGNKVTLTLETPITTPGSYDLNIYQGSFVSESGISQYAGIYFTIIDSAPGFETNYKEGDKVEEIGNLEISFKNVETVELKNTELTVLSITAGNSITGTAAYSEETGKITVTFSQALTEEDTYVFKIPAGMFTMNGVENEARDITVTLSKQTILPLAIVSTTPVEDENGNIVAIRVEFNQEVTLAYDENSQPISKNISLIDAQGNAINLSEDWNWTLPYTTLEYTFGAYDSDWNFEATPITEDGTYTLDLSQIVVDYAYDSSKYDYMAKGGYCEGTYTLVVGEGESTGIQQAEPAQESAVIYDLLGRRVEKVTTAGIYIVNGRKMIIK